MRRLTALRRRATVPASDGEKESLISIVSFLKEAGENLFGVKEAKAATTPAASGPTVAENVATLNRQASEAIKKYIASGLPA